MVTIIMFSPIDQLLTFSNSTTAPFASYPTMFGLQDPITQHRLQQQFIRNLVSGCGPLTQHSFTHNPLDQFYSGQGLGGLNHGLDGLNQRCGFPQVSNHNPCINQSQLLQSLCNQSRFGHRVMAEEFIRRLLSVNQMHRQTNKTLAHLVNGLPLSPSEIVHDIVSDRVCDAKVIQTIEQMLSANCLTDASIGKICCLNRFSRWNEK